MLKTKGIIESIQVIDDTIVSISCYSIIFLVSSILLNNLIVTFAISPIIQQQEILDNVYDMINMHTREIVKSAPPYSDIKSTSYISDGKNLNSTLWLFSFTESPKLKEVDYGMLLDVDLDNKTGFGGIDYKVEIQWNNETKTWNKVINSWSPFGQERTIASMNNYTGFYGKEKNYVMVSLDLQKIGFPNRYNVISYADSRTEDGNLIMDTTKSIVLPQTSFIEKYGNIISSLILLIILIIPTIFSLKPSLLSHRFPELIHLDNILLLQIDAGIITGVLIFLSLEGFDKGEQNSISLITANIVFPFAISAISSLTKHIKFSTRIMVAGFINLMVSIILIAFLRMS